MEKQKFGILFHFLITIGSHIGKFGSLEMI